MERESLAVSSLFLVCWQKHTEQQNAHRLVNERASRHIYEIQSSPGLATPVSF